MLYEEACPKRLAFVPGCHDLAFLPIDDDEMVCPLQVDGSEMLLCVKFFDDDDGQGQVHVTLRFPQRVPGHAALELVRELASDPDAFGMWADPCDGEVLVSYALERDDAGELAALIDRAVGVARKFLPVVLRYEAKASDSGEALDNPLNPDRLAKLGA